MGRGALLFLDHPIPGPSHPVFSRLDAPPPLIFLLPPFPATTGGSFSKALQPMVAVLGWAPGWRAAHDSAGTRWVPSKPLGPRCLPWPLTLQSAVGLTGTGALECWQARGQDYRVNTSPELPGQDSAVHAGVPRRQG